MKTKSFFCVPKEYLKVILQVQCLLEIVLGSDSFGFLELKDYCGRLRVPPVLPEYKFFDGATGIETPQPRERTEFEGWLSVYLRTLNSQ